MSVRTCLWTLVCGTTLGIAGSASAFLGFSQMAQAMVASFAVGAIGGNIHLTMAGATSSTARSRVRAIRNTGSSRVS